MTEQQKTLLKGGQRTWNTHFFEENIKMICKHMKKLFNMIMH